MANKKKLGIPTKERQTTITVSTAPVALAAVAAAAAAAAATATAVRTIFVKRWNIIEYRSWEFLFFFLQSYLNQFNNGCQIVMRTLKKWQ